MRKTCHLKRKRKFKRILCLVLSFVLLAGMVPANLVFAEGESDGVTAIVENTTGEAPEELSTEPEESVVSEDDEVNIVDEVQQDSSETTESESVTTEDTEAATENTVMITYDTQPTTKAEVKVAIEAYNQAYQDAMASGGFFAAIKVSKPHWEQEVPSNLMPSGWHCERVDWDTGFGTDYYTFFPNPVALATHIASNEAQLINAINTAGSGDVIEIQNNIAIGSSPITIPASQDVTIRSLGGSYTLTQANTNIRHFNVNGKMTLEDIALDGTNIGGGIVVQSGGNLIMDSGAAIRNCYRSIIFDNYGAGVFVAGGGSFTMFDGEISDNIVGNGSSRGGGVYVDNGGMFNMGGAGKTPKVNRNTAVVPTGSAGGDGGGIHGRENSQITIQNGEISDNKADGSGGGILSSAGAGASSTGIFEITGLGTTIIKNNEAFFGGGIYISNRYVSHTIKNCNITDNEAVSDNMGTGGHGGGIATGGGMNGGSPGILTIENCDISDNDAAYNGGGIYIGNITKTEIKNSTINRNEATYTGVPTGMTEVGQGGGIYCWNRNILTIRDCEIDSNVAAREGGGVCFSSSSSLFGSTFTLYDGKISNNKSLLGNGGGGVYMSVYTTFTMHDGEISNNTTTGWGGGVFAYHTNFTMNDGIIKNNTADGYGGGVAVYDYGVSFTMNGGTIKDNVSKTSGGGVFINTSNPTNPCSFDMNDGKVTGNTAYEYGGGVYVYQSRFIIGNNLGGAQGAPEISGNKAEDPLSIAPNGNYGGGVHVEKSALAMYYGEINDNYVDLGGGGGVYIFSGSTFNMSGGKISGNRIKTANSSGYGGGVFVSGTGSAFAMYDGEINNNAAILGGGGICLDNSRVTIGRSINTASGYPLISGNTATEAQGGGMFVSNSSVATMNRGEISGNGKSITLGGTNYRPTASGGGVYVESTGNLSITGLGGASTISNNSVQSYMSGITVGGDGGGIYTDDSTYANLNIATSTVFSGNIADSYYIGAIASSYPNIQTSSTSVPGTFLLNNFDINYVSGTVHYTVIYNANGGTGTSPVLGSGTTAGSPLNIAANTFIAPAGMQFKEWNIQTNGLGTSYTQGATMTMPSNNLTLYAIWEPVSAYALTIQAGAGGTITTGTSGSYTAGTVITIIATPNTGYTFSGWTSSGSGTFASASNASTTFTMPAANVTVTANFATSGGSGGGSGGSGSGGSTTTYTVAYDANGGMGSHNVTSISSGSKHRVLGVDKTNISNTDYTFIKWNTKADGSGTDYITGDSITITGNVTLYAQWEQVLETTETTETAEPSTTDESRKSTESEESIEPTGSNRANKSNKANTPPKPLNSIKSRNRVNTNDNSNIVPWIIALSVSFAVITLLILKDPKRKKRR